MALHHLITINSLETICFLKNNLGTKFSKPYNLRTKNLIHPYNYVSKQSKHY